MAPETAQSYLPSRRRCYRKSKSDITHRLALSSSSLLGGEEFEDVRFARVRVPEDFARLL